MYRFVIVLSVVSMAVLVNALDGIGANMQPLVASPDDDSDRVIPLEMGTMGQTHEDDDIILMGDVENAMTHGQGSANAKMEISSIIAGGNDAAKLKVSGAVANIAAENKKADSNDGLSTGAIVGIVVGCVVGVALLGLIVFVVVSRDSKADKYKKMAAYEPATIQTAS